MTHRNEGRKAAAFLFLFLVWGTMAVPQTFSLPLNCRLGEDCYIQLYVDRDPGPGFVDSGCGPLSYDAHTGTDFAVPSLQVMGQGVDVVAAAPGRVIATRDGMPDISQDTPGAPDVDQRGCGNAVLIDHGNGWRTDYCHLRLGTVAVVEGDRVDTGDRLGQVGLSGNTTFPHLEFILRRNGEPIDPFHPAPSDTCGVSSPLWDSAIPYRATGLLTSGFAPAVPTLEQVEIGLPVDGISDAREPIVLWVYGFGGQPQDTIGFELIGPDNRVIRRHEAQLESSKLQYFQAFGLRAPAGGWSPGDYSGTLTLRRDGVVVDTRRIAATLP